MNARTRASSSEWPGIEPWIGVRYSQLEIASTRVGVLASAASTRRDAVVAESQADALVGRKFMLHKHFLSSPAAIVCRALVNRP